jgi:GT2 family glycosyltransferase
MLKVAIVILNWNGKSFLEQFLPSVIQYCPDYAQVIIADNNSDDGSSAFMESTYPSIRFISLDKNYGYTGGYNRALKMINAQYFILLNSDIWVNSNWIDPLVELMDSDESIAACQPNIRSHHDQSLFEYAGAAGGFIDRYGYPFCRGRLFDTLETDAGQYNNSTDIFWATGACMFVRAVDLRDAGWLDEDFFAHMEEIDLCWRLKRMGKRVVFCNNSVVYHVGGGTLPKNNPRKTYLNFRNNHLLLAKNLPISKFYPIAFIRIILDEVAAIKFLLSGQYKDAWAVNRAFYSVLTLLRRKRAEGKNIPYKSVDKVYKRSIVIDYFLAGIKRFSGLNPHNFGKL